jgi:demethylmenaquinone methyltransferase/2-methoxy-6-polyprenyl-1,4-benzoquinol methylase
VWDIYQLGANYYNFFVKLYPLIGFRINAYRKCAIKLLQLKRGDFVVELGCSTGLNFPLILEKIGDEGRLIGVDISSKMLAHAKSRVERAN